MTIDISIIIVNWNARPLLIDCLNSLCQGCAGITTEVWVIDNASSDGSMEALRTLFPWVNLVASPHNLGFARANNQIAAQTRGRYLLLLNPDTFVPPGALTALVQRADNDAEMGGLGPRLLNADGSPQRSCWRGYPGLTMALVDALYLWKLRWLPLAQLSEYRSDEITDLREVDHLLGACMLIRREAWIDVGPLDENYFLFLEETDWCLRARQKGWKVVYDPHVCVVHYGQHSMRQQPARNLPHLYRSYYHFYAKHHPGERAAMFMLKVIMGLAALIRVGLWSIRSKRTSSSSDQRQGQRMRDGYRQVLQELPSF